MKVEYGTLQLCIKLKRTCSGTPCAPAPYSLRCTHVGLSLHRDAEGAKHGPLDHDIVKPVVTELASAAMHASVEARCVSNADAVQSVVDADHATRDRTASWSM